LGKERAEEFQLYGLNLKPVPHEPKRTTMVSMFETEKEADLA
jgi:hypothetical protein